MSAMSISTIKVSKWARLAVAGLALAVSATAFAQNNQEKERTKAPPATQKSEPANQRSAPPVPERKAITPAAPQNTQQTPYRAPANVNPNQPARQPGAVNNNAAPTRQPGAMNNNAAPARQPGAMNNNAAPTRQPGAVDNSAAPARQPGAANNNAAPARQPGAVNNNAAPARQPGAVNNNAAPARQPGAVNNNVAPARPGLVNGGNVRTPGNAAPARGNRPADFHGANNTQVHYGANGRPQVVQTRNMTIMHGPAGTRQVMVTRPDRSVIVTNNAGHGYIQRPYAVRNVTYMQRTYYVGGVPYMRVYRPYVWGGLTLNLYAPGRFYSPGFYMWAYNPWAAPVVFNWGWMGSPWYGYYGGWFTPYPSYANASFWLTDYIMAMTLQQAYQDRMDAQAAANQQAYNSANATPLTPDVKQEIADEVRLQLNEERAEGQNPSAIAGVPDFLTDNSSHVFVVSSNLFVTTRNGGQCAVTEGDVLQMASAPPPGSPDASVVVLASKGADCRRGTMVAVGVPELADMVSNMRATMDQGLAELQQGQRGLPAPPPAAPVEAPYAAAAPPPDQNVASELNQQAQASTQAEADVLNQAQQANPNAGAAPVSISLGMTIDQVVALMGQPQQIGDLGSKQTYFYANMKVIFTDGKVTDVQ